MQQDLVEHRGWISPADYEEGLALAQLAPAPLAAQLAIYLGWIRGRVLGATRVETFRAVAPWQLGVKKRGHGVAPSDRAPLGRRMREVGHYAPAPPCGTDYAAGSVWY